MLISVGILARNEERAIEGMLRSLFQQTALQAASGDPAGCSWEVLVVPNGCSDGTAAVSRHVLSDLAGQAGRRDIAWRVCEVEEGGKSNAWNRFVHEFSSPGADLLAMMDADIEFGERETLANTVAALSRDPRAAAAVDLPLKDAAKKRRPSAIERLSVRAAGDVLQRRAELCGQFFVARSDALRRIWMPKGLSVEDGFLDAMLVTNCFREPADYARIIRAAGASHYYETLASLEAIFRHELRLVIGTTLNCYLLWDFLLFATDPAGDGAGELIRRQMQRDPDWYEKLMTNSIRTRGWWVLPRDMLLRRFAARKRRALGAKWLLKALVGFALDLPVCIAANRRIKKLDSIGYW
jgi:glycosyltransferase involved in cell wall biosynthesis